MSVCDSLVCKWPACHCSCFGGVLPADAPRRHTFLQHIFRRHRRPEERHLSRFRKHLSRISSSRVSGSQQRPRSAGRQRSRRPSGSCLITCQASDDSAVGLRPIQSTPVHNSDQPSARSRPAWGASASQGSLLPGQQLPPSNNSNRLRQRSLSSDHLLQQAGLADRRSAMRASDPGGTAARCTPQPRLANPAWLAAARSPELKEV